ncbi:hypothetical protein D9615_004130 [Tricholomella constricta]|uniref:Uncharacterized protein n=1 Tax=Tricholomella constricta TaxID=117010 RepID=A0A8H5HD72_9AGAR|nr:hypothetical protein D9615_004130 [Tricholomella constricta]
MYSVPQTSQFRRPWSPEPFEPMASTSLTQALEFDPYSEYPRAPPQRQRREGSDVSVEALDLADYARTLRAYQHEDPYPPHPAYPAYPPSPLRPLSSYDSLQPPSLVSRGGTRSSTSHSSPSRSRHRPFSLPPPSRHTSAASNRASHSPFRAEPRIQSQGSEIDVAHFPAWSRNWYNSRNTGTAPASPPDIYTALPMSHFNSATKRSPFDPGYIHRESDDFSDPYSYAPTSSLGHDSTRNLLPWSNDPLDDPPIDSTLKEERMRMLEREFGPKGKGKDSEDGEFLDENGKPLVGTVDEKGNLVTQGPKKRMAVRVLQILLSLTAGIPSIYAALVIKPKVPPPPAGKPPAFVLYILSVITLLLLLYLFVFRPCCCTVKRPKGPNNPLANGMMVLPVQGLPGGKKGKKQGGKKGKGPNGSGQGDVQVNLIVDPEVFGRREEESDEEDDGEWGESIPGSYGSGRKKRKPRRRSVFAGLAMEESWKRARGWAKKLAVFDVVGLILWGAAFVFVLIGKRCPSGGFDGWCNAYNVSSAAACLLCIAFGLSTFFDVKDLHGSKVSPRTRT